MTFNRKIAVLTLALTGATLALAQDSLSLLSGAWRMISLESGTKVGNLQEVPYSGEIVFTEAGTMSVQAMNPDADAAPTPYTMNGYEAFYGSLDVDEEAKTFVVTVDSALVRDLIGQDLERAFEVSENQLILTPTSPDEFWRVTYERQ